MYLQQRLLWILVLLTALYGAAMQTEMSGYVQRSGFLGASPLTSDCRHAYVGVIGDLEMAKDPGCFSNLIAPIGDWTPSVGSDRNNNLKLAELNTKLDLAFISLYWLTYLAFAWLYGTSLSLGRMPIRLVAVAVTIVITLAAVYDVREDLRLFSAFPVVAQGHLGFKTPFTVSRIKWCLLGIATVLLGMLPITDAQRVRKLLGMVLIASGACMVVGTLAYSNPAFGMFGLSLALLFAIFTYFPWSIKVSCTRKSSSQWLQYLYFLRFPILGWLFLPALCYLDGCTSVDSVTRGIMTLSSCWQAFHAAFFVTALLMAALICARNIVRNGRVRFATAPPPSLRRALTKPTGQAVWGSLLVAHIPTVFALFYIATTTFREREPFGHWGWKLWASYGLGLLLAVVFWYLVSLFYLWIFPANVGRTPSALLFPGTTPGFIGAQNTSQPRVSVWIETIARRVLWFTHTGYAASSQGPLWEMHSLTTVSLIFFLLLYLFLYPLIAPVVFSNGVSEAILAVVIVLLFVYGARKSGNTGGMDNVGRAFIAITAALLGIFLGYLFYDVVHHRVVMETAFPTIASVLVISTLFVWLLSGAGFFFDRYRVPVFTSLVLLIWLPKYLPVNQEHYFSTTPTTRIDAVDTPDKVVLHRVLDSNEPYIIVTASGGGIQAAEWTAEALAQLEKRFRGDQDLNGRGKRGYLFHDHVLLASGVSGGSVGLVPFLLEYSAPPKYAFADSGKSELDRRLTKAAGCSSLEAVAWGLEYYDLQRLLFTVRLPWLQSTSNGEAPDRTWALSKAFNRNLSDRSCGTYEIAKPQGLLNGEQMTLKQAAKKLEDGSMPAFVFNTTVAETGGRFLLSNYAIPPAPLSGQKESLEAGTDDLPAESFLQAYTQEPSCQQKDGKGCYADVSLATAARLSATFPLVSSGTRVPQDYAGRAAHFLDGGYYDNDGTASVIEFLHSALRDPAQPKLEILLVEIRDSDDLNPTENMDDWSHQNGFGLEQGTKQPKPWTSNTQLIAPLLGMWNAGHVSVTRRNRRELCLLETTFAATKQLELHHIVLGITAEPRKGENGGYKDAPLSWKLTASQKEYIQGWAQNNFTQSAVSEAIAWIKTQLYPGQNVAGVVETSACEAVDQTYMRRNGGNGDDH